MQKQTTVTIDQKTFATLDRLAKSNDVSKKEFLSCALEYFEKYGINPVQHESPAKEMQKLIKRCDQVIAFIRKQEQDILRPACAAISTTEARIERVLDKLATAGQVRDLQKAVSDQQQRQNYDARNLLASLAASCCTAFIACCRISAVVPFLIAFRYSKLSFISLL
jgi:hypothetical protein